MTSFGVVLFELITGMAPLVIDPNQEDPSENEITSLVNFVQPMLDNVRSIIDPTLGEEYNLEAAEMLVRLARSCTERYGKYRPFMDEVCFRLINIKNTILGISDTLGENKLGNADVSLSAPLSFISASGSGEDSGFMAPISEEFFHRPEI